MEKRKERFRKIRIGVLLAGAVLFSCSVLFSEAGVRLKGDDGTAPVLVLGEDLTESQKKEVLEILELDERGMSSCRVLTVTGEQVREKLGDSWPEEAVEDTALSCILVTQVYDPVGLQVTTKNIDWCTEAMYQKLLSEAGILSREDERLDLDVRVAAPSGGSPGTAALIGALTACEEIRGRELGEYTEERALNMALETWKEASKAAEEKAKEEAEETTEEEENTEAGESGSMAGEGPDGIGKAGTGQVDLLTGQLYLEQQDFPGGEESPMEFTRYYRSPRYTSDRIGNFSGLGTYWMHSYFYYAEIFRTNVCIYLPNGTTQNWYLEYRRGWQTSDTVSYTLEERGEDFLLTGPEGEKILFGSDGWVTEITEADGSRTKFFYEEGKLSRVESEEGSLEFEFKEDFLYSVTDHAGNTVTFEQDRNGNLIRARSGELEREYTYDEHEDRKTGSNLTSVTDEHGKLLLLAVYQSGVEVGSACQVAYIRTEDQTEKAFVYDPYEGIHTCLDPDGSSLVLTYETPVAESYTWTWYDAQGNILRQEVTSD